MSKMKLTEPQERALRKMYERKADPSYSGMVKRGINGRTGNVLCDHGLAMTVDLGSDGIWYRITHKGMKWCEENGDH